MSGAAAETRSRMGRGADVPELADRGVAWRPDEASGRHSKLWSSSAEPPYGSPLTALGLRARRSSCLRTSIARILSRKSGACRAIRSSNVGYRVDLLERGKRGLRFQRYFC